MSPLREEDIQGQTNLLPGFVYTDDSMFANVDSQKDFVHQVGVQLNLSPNNSSQNS